MSKKSKPPKYPKKFVDYFLSGDAMKDALKDLRPESKIEGHIQVGQIYFEHKDQFKIDNDRLAEVVKKWKA